MLIITGVTVPKLMLISDWRTEFLLLCDSDVNRIPIQLSNFHAQDFRVFDTGMVHRVSEQVSDVITRSCRHQQTGGWAL